MIKKIKQEWNSLYAWVKIVLIILGILSLFLLVFSIPKLLNILGSWIGKILNIQGY